LGRLELRITLELNGTLKAWRRWVEIKKRDFEECCTKAIA